MDPLQFPLKFIVELEKLQPQVPVTLMEPEFPFELAGPVSYHPLKISRTLELGINSNPLPQISEIPIN